jgi:predicted amidophosphoribosyltransferase
MAMQEVVCTACGAINRLVAHACWRCLEVLSDRSSEDAEVAEAPPEPRPATA